MKKALYTFITASLLFTTVGCKKYLDVNSDPNNPTSVEAALLLPSILQNFSHGIQIDNRYIARYVQQWHYGAAINDQWDQHGYTRSNDRGGAMFRSVYWRGGYNLINLIKDAEENEKWDYAGVGYALQAYGWQTLTDIHGEIILDSAFTVGKTAFSYTKEEKVYMTVRELCKKALENLNRADGKVSVQSLGRGDQIYKGDRSKWIKFVYGILARNYNHLSKKSTLYKPDSVVYFVDQSFASNADDAFTPSEAAAPPNDVSPYGQSRSVISGEEAFDDVGQSWYSIVLMDSTNFGGVKITDPRRDILLQTSVDGKYRGLNPAKGAVEISNVNERVRNFYGLTMGTQPSLTQPGKYLYRNEAPVPIMTYAELQFIKAEAQFRMGDVNARNTYINAIKASIDFVGTVNNYSKLSYVPGAGTSSITTAARDAYANNPNISPATITLSHIMRQKWIALYGWGAHEVWSDMRRYDYDPLIYPGLTLPTPLFVDNNNKVVQRLRMRFNSEYVWNQAALAEIGGLDADFHTKPIWQFLP